MINVRLLIHSPLWDVGFGWEELGLGQLLERLSAILCIMVVTLIQDITVFAKMLLCRPTRVSHQGKWFLFRYYLLAYIVARYINEVRTR